MAGEELYSLYDLTERTVEVDFYLNSHVAESGEYHEERSQIFRFGIPASETIFERSS